MWVGYLSMDVRITTQWSLEEFVERILTEFNSLRVGFYVRLL
jgi:hypothetical protein